MTTRPSLDGWRSASARPRPHLPRARAALALGGGRLARALRAAPLVALLAGGCDRDLSRSYDFVVRVSSDAGTGVEGTRASAKGRSLGVADASGAIDIRVRGREGDVLSIDIECPPGHRAPPAVLVPLRQMGRSSRRRASSGQRVLPEFATVCTPLTHSIVVAVRAERGAHLPLLHLGRELTRTDSSGAAHLRLDVASDDVVELVLDTTEQPQLRPKSPVLRIQPGSSDEIIAASQDFTLLTQTPAKKVVAPRGPTRIE